MISSDMFRRILIAAAALCLCSSPNVDAASSGSVVLSEVLTGTSQSASAEFVELRNQTSQDIDMSGWKVQYLSVTGTTVTVKATLGGTLRAGGYLLTATTEFGAPGDTILSSGLPESGGRLRLVDNAGTTIDALSWGSSTTPSEGTPAPSPQRGQSLLRAQDTNNNAADFVLSDAPTANGGDVYEPVDVCPNIAGNQEAIPPGYQLNADGECVPIIKYPIIRLNEILPDPGSPKTDANDEFIELYNPNDHAVDMTGYRLLSGSNLTSVYTLPTYIIPAHGYLVLYSSETKISLTNSGSKLLLQSPDQKPVGDALQYGAVGADQAWAYFVDGWKLTDKPTPNATNELVVETEAPGMGSGETSLAPCPSGKYRHPLTNRCRNIETDASVLAACDADEYRNPETNRCRKVSLASATVTPCQPGYERNSETNRCRKVAGDESSLKPCDPSQERNPETNRCKKVAGASMSAITDPPDKKGLDAVGGVALGIVGLAAVGYGAYEWRGEIAGAFGRLLAALGKK